MQELRRIMTTMEMGQRRESRAETGPVWVRRWRGTRRVRTANGDWRRRAEGAVKKTKQRGGALLMQPLMPPGWTPPTGPPPGAPQDKDEDMTETVVAEPGGGADAATGAEGAGDAERDGDKDMEDEEPGEQQYLDDTEEQGRGQRQGQQGKFFSQEWITQVKGARAGKVSKTPLERAPIVPLDQRKLMLHLDCEDVSLVLQPEGHLTMGTERSSEQQVSWQALLAMPREEQLAWAQDRKEKGKVDEDVLLVVEQRDLAAVRSLQGLLSRLDPGGAGCPCPVGLGHPVLPDSGGLGG